MGEVARDERERAFIFNDRDSFHQNLKSNESVQPTHGQAKAGTPTRRQDATATKETINPVTAMKKITLLFASLAVATFFGCQPTASTTNATDSAVVTKHRAERVLTEQPESPVGILELMTQLAGDSATPERATSETVTVALLGKLSSANNDVPVFVDDEAAFSMIDPSYQSPDAESVTADADHADDDDGHAHADESATADSGHKADCACPFCQSSKTEVPYAIVKFVSAEGETLPIGAKELFELDEDQLVVVTGSAKLSVGQLMVTADKIYVRK